MRNKWRRALDFATETQHLYVTCSTFLTLFFKPLTSHFMVGCTHTQTQGLSVSRKPFLALSSSALFLSTSLSLTQISSSLHATAVWAPTYKTLPGKVAAFPYRMHSQYSTVTTAVRVFLPEPELAYGVATVIWRFDEETCCCQWKSFVLWFISTADLSALTKPRCFESRPVGPKSQLFFIATHKCWLLK